MVILVVYDIVLPTLNPITNRKGLILKPFLNWVTDELSGQVIKNLHETRGENLLKKPSGDLRTWLIYRCWKYIKKMIYHYLPLKNGDFL